MGERPAARIATRSPRRTVPHAELESLLFAEGAQTVAGVDEVGRGAWAGPMSVGVVLLDLRTIGALPEGVADSKSLTPAQRVRLLPRILAGCLASAVGHASSQECDDLGMTAAQQLAARRALALLGAVPDAVVVDGKVDFTGHPRAVVSVGADRSSLSVASASIVAKVTRDGLLVDLASRYPGYGWERNKGYASLEHRHAVARLGMTPVHRRRWTFARPLDAS